MRLTRSIRGYGSDNPTPGGGIVFLNDIGRLGAPREGKGDKRMTMVAVRERPLETERQVTAAQAIRMECRSCCRTTPRNCPTETCKLSPNVFKCRSSAKRIGAHCRDCAGEARPIDCTGRVLKRNGNVMIGSYYLCWLHPFRLGKNPYRPKWGSPHPNSLAALRSRGQNPALKSTISYGVGG